MHTTKQVRATVNAALKAAHEKATCSYTNKTTKQQPERRAVCFGVSSVALAKRIADIVAAKHPGARVKATPGCYTYHRAYVRVSNIVAQ